MMFDPDHIHRTLLPIGTMARRLRVPLAWLRDEADSGRIPHLKAGKAYLFDPSTVEAILVERSKTENKKPE